jgi:hypothetical protein
MSHLMSLSGAKRTCPFALQMSGKAEVNLPLGCRVFGNSKRGDHSATMRYMIAKKHSIARKK